MYPRMLAFTTMISPYVKSHNNNKCCIFKKPVFDQADPDSETFIHSKMSMYIPNKEKCFIKAVKMK